MSDCNSNTLFSDCMLFNIDLSKVKSYDSNSAYTISSLTKWCNAVSDKMIVEDFGLTMYDVGRTTSLTANTLYNTLDTTYKMYRIGENDGSGHTSYSSYTITPQFDVNSGLYFQLSGGYFQNFFKLYDYQYEILPYRFNNGFTFEAWLKIDDSTFSNISSKDDGFFLYLGTRAENKYTTLFSGDTTYQTSTGYTLGPDNIGDLEDGLKNNVLGFKFNDDKTLGYRYIDENSYVLDCSTNKQITATGWTMISLSFNPYETIDNFAVVMDCAPDRLGDLSVYINGRLFEKVKSFPEFWFKPLNTDKEKQVGVPYNISWGGGSFGLKHSWNFNPYFKKDNTDLISLNTTSLTGISSTYSLSSDTITYYSGDTSSIAIYNSNSAVSITDSTLLKINNPIILEENKQYEFTCYINNTNLFPVYNSNDIIINLSGLTSSITGVTIIEQISYLTNPSVNNWIKLKLVIQTPKNWLYKNLSITPSLQMIIGNTNQVNQFFKMNIDEFTCFKYNYVENEYAQNPNNQGLLIEDNFNGSFYGGIQKLRMHACSLDFTQIQHNFKVDNLLYGKFNTFGGRVIYY